MDRILGPGGANSSSQYRPDIDGLRAIAVLAVVVHHASRQIVPGGFAGVDVFFVISGYLITGILIDDLEAKRYSVLGFYARRVRRIFPALLLVLVATLGVGWLVLFRPEYWSLGQHVAASALFVENFQLWGEAGYFDTASHDKPLLHLWSLAIEEQFYILWPLLLWAVQRLRVNFLYLIGAIFLASLALNIFDTHTDPTAAYYSPFGRAWELAMGAGLALAKRRAPNLLSRAKHIQSVLGAVLLLGEFALVNDKQAFPGVAALPATLGAALLIAAGPNGLVNKWLLSRTLMVRLGLISYPLYLWHWMLLSFGGILLGVTQGRYMLALLAPAFVLAALTYWLIELPVRKAPRTPMLPIALAAAMAAMLALGGYVYLANADPRLSHYQFPTRIEWRFMRFYVDPAIRRDPDTTTFMYVDRPESVLFLGDSHVMQYSERVFKTQQAEPDRLGAVFIVGPQCIPIDHIDMSGPMGRHCAALRARGLDMATGADVSRVLLGANWTGYFLDSSLAYQDGDVALPLTSPEGRRAALAQLEREITAISRAGKRVYLLLGNPYGESYAPRAARRSLYAQSALPAQAPLDPRQVALRHELLALARRTGAIPIDPIAALCADAACVRVRIMTADGVPIFRDQSHFNPDWTLDHATFIDVVTAPAR